MVTLHLKKKKEKSNENMTHGWILREQPYIHKHEYEACLTFIQSHFCHLITSPNALHLTFDKENKKVNYYSTER